MPYYCTISHPHFSQDYKLVTINLAEKEHKTPEYLKKQPFGVIPYLEDDDGLLMFGKHISGRSRFAMDS